MRATSEARMKEMRKRRIAQRLRGIEFDKHESQTPARMVANPFSGIRVAGIEQDRKGGIRYAKIQVGRSDFYSPAVALGNLLKKCYDPKYQPSEVRRPDVNSVSAVAPGEQESSNANVTSKSFFRRMVRITGGGWERFVRVSGGGFACLFVFVDRVLYQEFKPGVGFINRRATEEEIEAYVK